MHCCVCSRVCHHIGGPFYCSTHQPVITVWPPVNPLAPSVCTGHCYCQVQVDNHIACCNCGNRQKAQGGQ